MLTVSEKVWAKTPAADQEIYSQQAEQVKWATDDERPTLEVAMQLRMEVRRAMFSRHKRMYEKKKPTEEQIAATREKFASGQYVPWSFSW